MDHCQVAERLFAALSQGARQSAQEICASDFRGQQNFGPELDLTTLLDFTAAVHTVVSDFRYTEVTRTATAKGFVEEHLVQGTLQDGTELRLAACVVGEVKDGKVHRLREYVDGAAAKPLLRALSQG